MHRNYQLDSSSQAEQELTNQTAFHEAGHAASIYFGNKRKKLPPVFFQIQIKKAEGSNKVAFAKVIDGHLIQSLPIAGLDSISSLSQQDQLDYQAAYEADVINLLVGPLAEAKYVSIRDDEPFSFNLINAQALNYYGGSTDVKKAYIYLEYFIVSDVLREEKMVELFFQAFLFIERNENWRYILNLAHYILDSDKDMITCEEAVGVLKRL